MGLENAKRSYEGNNFGVPVLSGERDMFIHFSVAKCLYSCAKNTFTYGNQTVYRYIIPELFCNTAASHCNTAALACNMEKKTLPYIFVKKNYVTPLLLETTLKIIHK
jgi:hypothetical protein